MSFLEKEVCNYLPDIRKLGLDDVDEKQFYKLIGLTHDEINTFDKNNIINNITNDDDSSTDNGITAISENKTLNEMIDEMDDEVAGEMIDDNHVDEAPVQIRLRPVDYN